MQHFTLIILILSSGTSSVAVCSCLNPSASVKLILTEELTNYSPMIGDLFQRTHTLWSSSACSFKRGYLQIQVIRFWKLFLEDLVKPITDPVNNLHERAGLGGLKLFMFYKVRDSSCARAAVTTLQKVSVGGY